MLKSKLAPISAAMLFLFSGDTYAAGSASGSQGTSNPSQPTLIGAGGDIVPGSVSGNGAAGAPVSARTLNIGSGTFVGGSGGAGGHAPGGSGGSGGGAGGNGGASAIGGISTGGSGGGSSFANGGAGGSIRASKITLEHTSLNGSNAAAGQGGNASFGGAGAAGHGGGSVSGGISTGGAGGESYYNSVPGLSANGGAGGDITDSRIHISGSSSLLGAAGGQGGNFSAAGGAGAAGHGGGSVFGGISTGGAGGYSYSSTSASANGARGGSISASNIRLENATLDGSSAGGGQGGGPSAGGGGGGGGAAGHGGGSVFGGISTGGAGGFSDSSAANGGGGGRISASNITLKNATLNGSSADGGQGGNAVSGGAGAAGHGGGSVFGGISTGGAGGFSLFSANGGAGGVVSGNQITLTSVSLDGSSAVGGQGGNASSGGVGAAGYGGGSVFGGVSIGGAGGYSAQNGAILNGGAGGDVLNNKITISGISTISGDIYGGISQGGAKGGATTSNAGRGGLVQNNTLTLIGAQITLGGALYGGWSIDGDGFTPNLDPAFTSFYQGNTLSVQGYRGTVQGIYNFEKYKWTLPKDVFNGDTIFSINNADSNYKVALDNTKHKVDVLASGNTLDGGDTVILINKAQGAPQLLNYQIEQGFFIVYDAEMKVESDQLVLRVLGVKDNQPDGKVNPESEAFLKGRVAQLAQVDQGADMMSDGIWSARASLRKENANLFVIADGGANRYKAGSNGNIKLHDLKFAVGAVQALKFNSDNVGMLGVFAEHGNGNYESYSSLGSYGKIHGSGKTRYNGVGALFHMDIAGTDVSKVQNKPNIFDFKYGLYLHGVLRVGHANVDFRSADMVNGYGVEGSYSTKSRYVTAMVGAGYVLTLDAKSAVDFYGRHTFSRLNGKNVQVVDEPMGVGAAHSHRLRLGVRYGYAYSDKVTPYAGVAYERNFNGDVSGSAYGFTIKEKSLKGNSGLIEAGVLMKPKGVDDPLSLHMGLQAYLGQREGVAATLKARYVF